MELGKPLSFEDFCEEADSEQHVLVLPDYDGATFSATIDLDE